MKLKLTLISLKHPHLNLLMIFFLEKAVRLALLQLMRDICRKLTTGSGFCLQKFPVQAVCEAAQEWFATSWNKPATCQNIWSECHWLEKSLALYPLLQWEGYVRFICEGQSHSEQQENMTPQEENYFKTCSKSPHPPLRYWGHYDSSRPSLGWCHWGHNTKSELLLKINDKDSGHHCYPFTFMWHAIHSTLQLAWKSWFCVLLYHSAI